MSEFKRIRSVPEQRTASYELFEYKGHEVRIYQDFDAANPLTEWDCEPPTLVFTDGCFTEYGLDQEPPALTRRQIKANLEDIVNFFDEDTLLQASTAYLGHYLKEYANAAEAVNEMVAAFIDSEYDSDRLDLLEQVWQWAGYQTFNTARTDYCRGDSIDILCVATPEWVEKTGIAPESVRDALKATVDTYAAWAFGDVFGVEVLEESCWGFYGTDHEKSGLLDFVKEIVHSAS